jgi:hypothetical protein
MLMPLTGVEPRTQAAQVRTQAMLKRRLLPGFKLILMFLYFCNLSSLHRIGFRFMQYVLAGIAQSV